MERLKYRRSSLYIIEGKGRRKRRGITLTEALVLSLIILLIVLSVISLYILALQGRQWGERKASAEEKARLAMEWILRDIRMATEISVPQEGGSTIVIYQPMLDANGDIIYPIVRDPEPITYYLSQDGEIIRQKGTEGRTIAKGITSLAFSMEGSLDSVKVNITAKEGEELCSLEGRAWARN